LALLKSVRAKLTTLVALSAIAALAALPFMHWVMTRQLVDVVDDRLPDAVRGFDLELADDEKDLAVAVRTLSDSDELESAIMKEDGAAAAEELREWHETYPGIGLVAFDLNGKPIANQGLPSLDAREGIPRKDQVIKEKEARFVRKHGCAVLNPPRPAYAILRKVRTAGYVMGCMTFDEEYLFNSAEKLGIQIAVKDTEGKLAFATKGFPTHALAAWKGTSEPAPEGNRAWALREFEPKIFAGEKNRFNVIAALDVTEIKGVVSRNVMTAAAILLITALTAVFIGTRVAQIMGTALGRINHALRKLHKDEYVHVRDVKTGDEIEDLATGFNTMVDGLRERDKLRSTFGKYMTRSVMEHLMKGEVELGGEELTVTVLFTDIRGFTTISETMSAQELVALLNEYFTEMVAIVIEENGVVDKYIGDAIMAVFGAPVPSADDAKNAVRAAVRMRAALVKLNERLKAKGKPELATGIGLHTGVVVAGNIGSEARMEYTVIGDTVNVASRLEGTTKDLNVGILVSEDTKAQLDDSFVTRPLTKVTVKGRAQPVMTYEVTGLR
jgi:adenylate cyclase